MSNPIPFRPQEGLIPAIDAYCASLGISRNAAINRLLSNALLKGVGPHPVEPVARSDRQERLTVYLSAMEKQCIQNKSQRYGLPASTFLRFLGTDHKLPRAIPELARLLNELTRQGSNLNQIAHGINSANLGARTFPSEKSILGVLKKVRSQIETLAKALLAGERGESGTAKPVTTTRNAGS